MMYKCPKALFVVISIYLASCTQASQEHQAFNLSTRTANAADAVEASVPAIRLKTVVPAQFRSRMRNLPGKGNFLVSRTMLRMAKIIRKRAEVRVGPGTGFELLPEILEHEDLLIVFDQRGVWKKVRVVGSGATGWIHSQMSERISATTDVLTLNLSTFPTVIVVKDLHFLHSFPDKKVIKVNIKKGTQFVALRTGRRSTLIWISETNSTAWLSRKYVK